MSKPTGSPTGVTLPHCSRAWLALVALIEGSCLGAPSGASEASVATNLSVEAHSGRREARASLLIERFS